MPITLTFDLPSNTDLNDRNRIRVAFERLGWEVMGGTAYRYPRLGSDNPSEDWFNHVVPALMYLRALCEKRDIALTRFTIDANTSAGFRQGGIGAALVAGDEIEVYEPNSNPEVLSAERLKKWIEACAETVVG